jgi:hypothetical protein
MHATQNPNLDSNPIDDGKGEKQVKTMCTTSIAKDIHIDYNNVFHQDLVRSQFRYSQISGIKLWSFSYGRLLYYTIQVLLWKS